MGLGLEARWLVPTSKWKKWKRNLFFLLHPITRETEESEAHISMTVFPHWSIRAATVKLYLAAEMHWNRGSSYQEFQVKWKPLAAADQSLKVFHALNAFFLLTLFPPSAFTDLCPASFSKCTQSLLKSRGERVKSFHCNEEGPAYPRVYF